MADDELILHIEKAFWPSGVMRGLAPALRTLGDKHGNLVIAAVAAKGQIMVKGAADKIEAVKPALRALIEEHLPDAPIPEELGGDHGAAAAEPAEAAPMEVEEEEEAPAPPPPPAPEPPKPAPPAPAPAPAPAAKAPAPAAAKAPVAKPKPAPAKPVVPAGPPQPPVAGRKRPRPASLAPPELLWECIRNTSSFIRKPGRDIRRPFSAEPQNLTAFHSLKYSGLVAEEGLDVRPVKKGAKETIELVQSHARASRRRRPASAKVTVGLSKCPARGLLRLDREIDAKFYRRGLLQAARQKYVKVQQSFKKKVRPVKSRRAKS